MYTEKMCELQNNILELIDIELKNGSLNSDHIASDIILFASDAFQAIYGKYIPQEAILTELQEAMSSEREIDLDVAKTYGEFLRKIGGMNRYFEGCSCCSNFAELIRMYSKIDSSLSLIEVKSSYEFRIRYKTVSAIVCGTRDQNGSPVFGVSAEIACHNDYSDRHHTVLRKLTIAEKKKGIELASEYKENDSRTNSSELISQEKDPAYVESESIDYLAELRECIRRCQKECRTVSELFDNSPFVICSIISENEYLVRYKDISFALFVIGTPGDVLRFEINDNIDMHDYSGKCIGTMDKETIKQAYEMVLQTH